MIPVADPGLQPERTAMSWTRTALAMHLVNDNASAAVLVAYTEDENGAHDAAVAMREALDRLGRHS